MWCRPRAFRGPKGRGGKRWLLVLGALAAAHCGGELAASDDPAAASSPPWPTVGADAAASSSLPGPSDAGATTDGAATDGSADATAPGGSADASPAPPDERAEAKARWLPACGPSAAAAGPAGSGSGSPAPPPTSTVPRLRVDAPEMVFPFEAVRRALRVGARRQVEGCVAQAHKAGPEPGRVALTRFVVAPNGKIESAELQVGTGDATLDDCLVTALQKPSMPKLSQGRVTMSKVPIVLCPDGRTLLWPDVPKAPPPTP